LIRLQRIYEWAKDKTWTEIYSTCHRGDWLLWLFKKTNPDDLQILTLAKGHCANTVRHLMKDERSTRAVDAAIAFGEGKITQKELAAAVSAAVSAAASTDYAAAYAATYATTYAAKAAANTAYTATFTAAADDTMGKANQKLTADICRKYLPMNIWNIKYDEK